METVIFLIVLGAILIIVDRIGDRVRPVEHSPAYGQALTGMIREPRAIIHVPVETPRPEQAGAPGRTLSEPVQSPAELVAHPS